MNTMERVVQLIDERDISLLRLLEMSGIAYSTLKSAKRRNAQLSVETIAYICKALGITLSEFFEMDFS